MQLGKFALKGEFYVTFWQIRHHYALLPSKPFQDRVLAG